MMREFNIMKLIDASHFSSSLSNTAKDALLDFYIDTNATIENINVDNDIVNSLNTMSTEEYNDLSETERENMSILCLDDDTNEIYYWN